jgi:hypothetical protein
MALLIVALIVFMQSKQKQAAVGSSRQNKELADRRWHAVRRVAEEDVTQLGQQIADTPVPQSLDPEAARDFDDALSAYERAKEALAASAHPDDLQWVSKSLDDGRFALAKLDARREGRELPSRRPPCFFDQRHGLSVADAQWAPAGGAMRDVPVCAACDARISDGLDPQARLVPTASGDRPYYEAGPEYAPWARGWYAGSGAYMMSNVLMGTMLFNALYLPPGYDYFGGDGGGDLGGDGGGDVPDTPAGADPVDPQFGPGRASQPTGSGARDSAGCSTSGSGMRAAIITATTSNPRAATSARVNDPSGVRSADIT